LQTGLVAVWVLCALYLVVANAAIQGARQAVQTIGRDSAPSIVAAAQIRASMADLDANVANLLLGPPNGMPEVERAIERDRIAITHPLVAAAENITYDQEWAPIETMVSGLGEYLQQVSEARLLHNRGDSAGALNAYRHATDLMHQSLLPSAVTLGTVNQQYLDLGYQGRRATLLVQEVVVGLLGVAGIATLIVLQVFLARRTKRMLNPSLVLATLVLAVLSFQTVGTLWASSATLKLAKQDAFDSVAALWQARAVAFDANGDESRYLLDPERASAAQTQFVQRTAALVDTGNLSLSQVVDAANSGQVRFKGYLADELNNITFVGERDAALATLSDFVVYLGLDAQIRALEQAGRHQEAVALCIGTQEGQSNWAYDRFDASLSRTLDINEQAFAGAIDQGFALVSWFPLGGPIGLFLVAGLTLLGLWPRLNEYRS
jgi:hypothetical protein